MELCRGVGVLFETVAQFGSNIGVTVEEAIKVKKICFSLFLRFTFLLIVQRSRDQMSILLQRSMTCRRKIVV
jgi:hypothetical protein